MGVAPRTPPVPDALYTWMAPLIPCALSKGTHSIIDRLDDTNIDAYWIFRQTHLTSLCKTFMRRFERPREPLPPPPQQAHYYLLCVTYNILHATYFSCKSSYWWRLDLYVCALGETHVGAHICFGDDCDVVCLMGVCWVPVECLQVIIGCLMRSFCSCCS